MLCLQQRYWSHLPLFSFVEFAQQIVTWLAWRRQHCIALLESISLGLEIGILYKGPRRHGLEHIHKTQKMFSLPDCDGMSMVFCIGTGKGKGKRAGT
jgi:hypothetical protein